MKKILRKVVIAIVSMLTMLAMISTQAGATSITFNGSNNDNLSASVTFDTFGANLIATLTNTGADVMVPADILTGVFFDLAGAQTLTSLSAVLNDGSAVFFGGTDPGGVVGGEWAYGSNLNGAPGRAKMGISSTGLNIFGDATFSGSNLQGPVALDGLQYGITSGFDNPATGNTPVTGAYALIKNSVVFTLSGLPGGFDPSRTISNVSFQYGTDLNEPNLPGSSTPVPEPGTMLLLGLSLIGLAGVRRKFQS